MDRINIPEELKGKELYKFLIDNKSALIAQKKSMLKYADTVIHSATPIKRESVKAAGTDNPDVCSVKVVANTAWYCDSQMDVLVPDNAKKSISERKGMIPHLHDHIHQISAQVGDVKNIYYQDMSLSELGLSKSGSTQVLIFETDIKKSYNEQVFNLYKSGKINQHSIGLQYVKLGLAINDEESVAEYELWQKYSPYVINQDTIIEKGYFWVVLEIKLLENSAVLFGSNPITPTLESKSDDTLEQPVQTTKQEPKKEELDIQTIIKQFNLFKI